MSSVLSEAAIGRSQPFASRLLGEVTLRRLSYYLRALEAVRYVCETLPAEVRLEEVAQRVGMNPASFSRYFTDKIGERFCTIVKTLRIERALEDLERHDSSIELLACRHGYGSGCTFARAFKDVVGESPSVYRRRMLGLT